MKRSLLMVLALGTLGLVSSVEARCGKKACAPRSCEKPCAPKCTTSTRTEMFTTPCKVVVDGVCDNERCFTTTVCEDVKVSEKCLGGCRPLCEEPGYQKGAVIMTEDME